MDVYFRSRDGAVDGPFDGAQVLGMWRSGELGPADLLCLEGTEEWVGAQRVVNGWEARMELARLAKREAPGLPTGLRREMRPGKKGVRSGLLGTLMALAAIFFLVMVWHGVTRPRFALDDLVRSYRDPASVLVGNWLVKKGGSMELLQVSNVFELWGYDYLMADVRSVDPRGAARGESRRVFQVKLGDVLDSKSYDEFVRSMALEVHSNEPDKRMVKAEQVARVTGGMLESMHAPY